jgi:hypothetical protein
MFNIEDHRRYVPKPRRRTQKRRETKAEQPVILPKPTAKPNFKETAQIPCNLAYDMPCKCRRMTGDCVQCRQSFTVTLGERADVMYVTEKGKILNYKCNRCRQYAR